MTEHNARSDSLADQISWLTRHSTPALKAEDVHVWSTSLDLPIQDIDACQLLLSPEECYRAERFRLPLHRNRFIVGRAFLRSMLGDYLDADPSHLQFRFGEAGKPALNSKFEDFGIHFNLAHTGDVALLALTRLGMIGVDVEYVRELPEMDELVVRFFSKRESKAFGQLSNAIKPIAFFNLWTRKEAWLKATGEGISYSLNRVEVSFLPDQPVRLISLPGNSSKSPDWSLYHLCLAPKLIGAIALAHAGGRVSCWHRTSPVSPTAERLPLILEGN